MNRELILYRNLPHRGIFEAFTEEQNAPKLFKGASELIEFACRHDFTGNLWHGYLTYVLVNNENAFTLAAERAERIDGSLLTLAENDLSYFKALFELDIDSAASPLGYELVDQIKNFKADNEKSKVYNRIIRNEIHRLTKALAAAETDAEFCSLLIEFYQKYGVSALGLHKAFRIEDRGDNYNIKPIMSIMEISFDDLIGYERQKQMLTENTEAFLEGKPANNVLLYGDSGTGKSSGIKALINKYYDKGLRMIEIYKHQFKYLADIITSVKDRNYKFIIYMDDLSFEEFEIEYKYLKAVIEGGLETKPKNVLIYATSNRRYLVKETWNDNNDYDADLHRSETAQEKLSLASRFGVQILYLSPAREEFRNIVRALAKRAELNIDDDTLMAEANKWEMRNGNLSGRTAEQFINSLCVKLK